ARLRSGRRSCARSVRVTGTEQELNGLDLLERLRARAPERNRELNPNRNGFLDAGEIQIWLLQQMLRGGSPVADQKLRELRIGSAEAEVVAAEVQSRLRAPVEESSIAHEA